MNIIIQIVAFVITVLVLVSVHEAGHFVVAKLLGMKVLRFSIGFGRPLYSYQSKSGTEYVIAWIPLGGYVKLLDEREVTVPEHEKHLAFNYQPLWARTAVVLAGPLTNILFAVLAFWCMFLVGITTVKPVIGKVIPESIAYQAGLTKGDEILSVDQQPTDSWQKVLIGIVSRLGDQDQMQMDIENLYTHQKKVIKLNLKNWRVDNLNPNPVDSLGIEVYRPSVSPVIQEVEKGGPAYQAGLKSGDKILRIANKPVEDWVDFVTYVHLHPNEKVRVDYLRGQAKRTTEVMIGKKHLNFKALGYIGVKPPAINFPPEMKRMKKYSFLSAGSAAWNETWQIFKFNFIVLTKMITGKISLSSVGGPISIFRTADLAFQQGAAIFLAFLAFISVMLAFINILPIPGLDGGHLLFFLIELLIGRPLSMAFEMLMLRMGLILLLLLMVVATMNDLLRLLTGGSAS